MALTIKKFSPKDAVIIPQQKLWLTEDKRQLVVDGDPRAAFLFCLPGRPIPKEEAARYGLIENEPAKEEETQKPVRPNPQSKVIELDKGNRSRKP